MSIGPRTKALSSSSSNSSSSGTAERYPSIGRLAKRLPPQAIIPVSGGIAGALAGIVSCPLDVIKTKLQAQGGFAGSTNGIKVAAAYKGVSGSAATIWREDGIRGMYRGLGPMLLGYIPTWAVYLTVYNKTQTIFRTKTENWFLANVYASLCAGACSTMATNPIWVIKTRLMSQSSSRADSRQTKAPWYYRNTWDAARKMYMHEGLLSFYSGLTPALLGLAHVAVQFPLYEFFKEKFTGITRGSKESEEDRDHHFYSLAAAVFLSKVCASTATYPHEVVRTRLQTQQRPSVPPASQSSSLNAAYHPSRPRGTWEICRMIYISEGWRGFYAGLGTNLIRTIPSAMTTILTFEYLKKTLFHLRDDFPDDLNPHKDSNEP